MGFFLFLLLNATLFVRPAEIVTDLAEWPIYEFVILGCLACNLPAVLGQLSWRSLRERPATVCVLLVLVTISLSHLAHFDLWSARHGAMNFAKSVLYYLLLVAVVDSPGRLRRLLLSVVACISASATLALLQYHGVVDIPSLAVLQQLEVNRVTGEMVEIPRLVSTGLFNDPNDLASILVLGTTISVYFLTDPRFGALRPVWLAPIALFTYALLLTKSRGGLLALAASIGIVFQARYGWKRSIWLAGICIPALLVAVGGRQANIGAAIGEGTGQDRVKIWSDGMVMFRGSPLFGVGEGRYSEHAELVAHNSFLHCFSELGFVGGAAFLGCFYCGTLPLYRLGQTGAAWWNVELRRLRPYLLAMVAGMAASLLTLSRPYHTPTYLPIGLATSYMAIYAAPAQGFAEGFNAKLVKRLALVSIVYLAAIWLFVRLMINRG